MQHIPSKKSVLHGPMRVQQPENQPCGTHICAMRAEHGMSTERLRPRATASRAHPRPAGESHERPELPTSICGMFLDSTMRPRNGLRQRVQRVSIERALSAGTMLATERPPRARC
jgi:hypothetical protein